MARDQCVILVGGLGTRLGALTQAAPKPMMPVGGQPFLRYLLHEVARFGFRRVVLLTGYRFQQIVEAFPARCELSPDLTLEIEHVVEPEPAGTGGALLCARDLLDEEFLLLNGDSLFDVNLRAFARFPSAGQPLARLALREVADASRYGKVTLAGERITEFSDERGAKQPGLINGGVYWLRRDVLDFIAQTPCSIERDVFPRLAAAGRLTGTIHRGFFIDIGVPEDLARAQQAIPAFFRRGAVFLDRDGVLNTDHGYVHHCSEFEWIEGAREAVRTLNDRGYLVFVVSNQAGVARGYYPVESVLELHRWINDQLAQDGAHIDAFRFCPHHPTEGVGDYRTDCTCRKPAPGMLQDLLAAWPVRPEQSLLIGDKESDVAAANAAGISGYRFDGGNLFDFVQGVLRDRAAWPASQP